MEEENKTKIIIKKMEIEEEIEKFKIDKEKELREYCVSMGGHLWWPLFNIFNSKTGYFEVSRKCPLCETREVFEVEEK